MRRRKNQGRTGARSRRLLFRWWAAVIATTAVLLPYAISFSSQGTAFALANRTKHYLHAIVNAESIVYLPPGRTVTVDVSGFSNVVAEVRYSPGQGMHGKISKEFEATRVTTTSERSSADCSNRQGTCSSSTDASSNETVNPITWVITPDLFSSGQP